jgi:FixJ family two-component response regulator
MPGTSGLEVRLLLGPSRPSMRVLYVSGYPDASFVHRGILPSDTPFLQKPFTRQGFAQKVRDVLDAPRAEGSGA